MSNIPDTPLHVCASFLVGSSA